MRWMKTHLDASVDVVVVAALAPWLALLALMTLSEGCILDVNIDGKRCDEDRPCVEGFCVDGFCVQSPPPPIDPLLGEGEGEVGAGEGEGEDGCVPAADNIERCNDGVDDDCDGAVDDGCLDCTDDETFPDAFVSVCAGPQDALGAAEACDERGLTLAILSDARFSDHVAARALGGRDDAWIGANDIVDEGNFRWLDGDFMVFEDFAPLQPNNQDQAQDCVELQLADGKWNDAPCSQPQGFICAKAPPPLDAPCVDIGAREVCGDRIDNDCDGVVDERCSSCAEVGDLDGGAGALLCQRLATWDEANHRCTDKRMSLAKLDSEALATLIDEPMRAVGDGRQRAWIGLNDQAAEGAYRWADGELLAFTRFEANEPTDATGQDCVDVRDDNGNGLFGWGDLNCATRSSYICTR